MLEVLSCRQLRCRHAVGGFDGNVAPVIADWDGETWLHARSHAVSAFWLALSGVCRVEEFSSASFAELLARGTSYVAVAWVPHVAVQKVPHVAASSQHLPDQLPMWS